jgi:RNA polymerase sigma-70 factor, ECF subfamily
MGLHFRNGYAAVPVRRLGNVPESRQTGVFFTGFHVSLFDMSTTTCFFSMEFQAETETLARGLRHRDPEVLDRLIGQYHYRLFRYLIYLTGRRDVAEDLFQEVWIKVIERGHQYDGRRRFETWLFAVARHLVIDRFRAQPSQRVGSLDDPDSPERSAPGLAAAEPSPLDAIARSEQSSYIAAALGELPAVYREALLLRFQEDMTLEEIAGLTAVPVSTVKSRVYRGLRALRTRLEKP